MSDTKQLKGFFQQSFPGGLTDKAVHEGIGCDVCSETVKGNRWKCANCQDYDLCDTCHDEAKHDHPSGHLFLKIRKPLSALSEAAFLPSPAYVFADRPEHEGFACDECEQPIGSQVRFACAVRADYDLCGKCEGSLFSDPKQIHGEEDYFPLLRITRPLSTKPVLETPEELPLSHTIPSDAEMPDQKHDGFGCDGCEGAISGYRHTCLACADYDLCHACYSKPEAEHPHADHRLDFLCIKSPATRQATPPFHIKFSCLGLEGKDQGWLSMMLACARGDDKAKVEAASLLNMHVGKACFNPELNAELYRNGVTSMLLKAASSQHPLVQRLVGEAIANLHSPQAVTSDVLRLQFVKDGHVARLQSLLTSADVKARMAAMRSMFVISYTARDAVTQSVSWSDVLPMMSTTPGNTHHPLEVRRYALALLWKALGSDTAHYTLIKRGVIRTLANIIAVQNPRLSSEAMLGLSNLAGGSHGAAILPTIMKATGRDTLSRISRITEPSLEKYAYHAAYLMAMSENRNNPLPSFDTVDECYQFYLGKLDELVHKHDAPDINYAVTYISYIMSLCGWKFHEVMMHETDESPQLLFGGVLENVAKCTNTFSRYLFLMQLRLALRQLLQQRTPPCIKSMEYIAVQLSRVLRQYAEEGFERADALTVVDEVTSSLRTLAEMRPRVIANAISKPMDNGEPCGLDTALLCIRTWGSRKTQLAPSSVQHIAAVLRIVSMQQNLVERFVRPEAVEDLIFLLYAEVPMVQLHGVDIFAKISHVSNEAKVLLIKVGAVKPLIALVISPSEVREKPDIAKEQPDRCAVSVESGYVIHSLALASNVLKSVVDRHPHIGLPPPGYKHKSPLEMYYHESIADLDAGPPAAQADPADKAHADVGADAGADAMEEDNSDDAGAYDEYDANSSGDEAPAPDGGAEEEHSAAGSVGGYDEYDAMGSDSEREMEELTENAAAPETKETETKEVETKEAETKEAETKEQPVDPQASPEAANETVAESPSEDPGEADETFMDVPDLRKQHSIFTETSTQEQQLTKEDGIIKQGPLQKQGRLFKKWMTRHFQLSDTGVLASARDAKSAPDLSKSVKVSEAVVGKGKSGDVLLVKAGPRSLLLKAASETERNGWLQSLILCGAKVNDHMSEESVLEPSVAPGDTEEKTPVFGYNLNEAHQDEALLNITVEDGKEREWNEEFQQARNTKCVTFADHCRRNNTTRAVVEAFQAEAQKIGRRIISEMFLPNVLKTIKPLDAGGVAGGEKYLVKGIFYKLVRQSDLYETYELAAAVAGHELKGLNAYLKTEIAGLNTSIMCVINFLGIRLIAVAKLPVNKTSLVYGSADAARSVHLDDPRMNSLMKQAGQSLNLKPHSVGRTTMHVIYGPCDVEGHKGTDGRLYVLDTARVFSPEAMLSKKHFGVVPPGTQQRLQSLQRGQHSAQQENYNKLKQHLPKFLKEQQLGAIDEAKHSEYVNLCEQIETVQEAVQTIHSTPERGAVLAKLLRKEFVQKNPVPLSSDAYTGFGRHNGREHNREVLEATLRLYFDTIPRWAQSFDLKVNGQYTHVSSSILSDLLHSDGINLRFLGLIRRLCRQEEARRLLLVVMLSRTLKVLHRATMRSTLQRMSESLPAGIDTTRALRLLFLCVRHATVFLLNIVFGQSDLASRFWCERGEVEGSIPLKFLLGEVVHDVTVPIKLPTVKTALISKYKVGLTGEELSDSPALDLRTRVPSKMLLLVTLLSDTKLEIHEDYVKSLFDSAPGVNSEAPQEFDRLTISPGASLDEIRQQLQPKVFNIPEPFAMQHLVGLGCQAKGVELTDPLSGFFTGLNDDLYRPFVADTGSHSQSVSEQLAQRQAEVSVYKNVTVDEAVRTAALNVYQQTYNVDEQMRRQYRTIIGNMANQVTESLYGAMSPEYCSALMTFAQFTLEGQFAKKVAVMQVFLQSHTQVRGPFHPSTISAYNNIGTNFGGLGEYAEALKHSSISARYSTQLYTIGEAVTQALKACGSYSLLQPPSTEVNPEFWVRVSAKYFALAFKSAAAAFSPGSPACLAIMAWVVRMLGRAAGNDTTEQYLERAQRWVELLKEAIPCPAGQHPITCTLMRQLGRIYNSLQRVDEALVWFERAHEEMNAFIAGLKPEDGEARGLLADNCFLLGLMHRKKGNPLKCIEHYEMAISGYEAQIPSYPPSTYALSSFEYIITYAELAVLRAREAKTKYEHSKEQGDVPEDVTNAVKDEIKECYCILERGLAFLNTWFSNDAEREGRYDVINGPYRQDIKNVEEELAQLGFC